MSKANSKLNKKKTLTKNLPTEELDWNVYFNISKEESQEDVVKGKNEKVALKCDDGSCSKYDSDDDSDCEDKKTEYFDCKAYMRALGKNHYSTFRVAFAVSPDATLPANCNGNGNGNGTGGGGSGAGGAGFGGAGFGGVNGLIFDQNGFVVPSLGINSSVLWQNFYLSLLRKVASYVKGIKNIEVVYTQTPQQALDLLDQGQVALVASPVPITRALLEDHAAIGVSAVNINRILLAYNLVIDGDGEDGEVACGPGTFVVELNGNLAELNGNPTFDQVVEAIRDAAEATQNDTDATNDFLIIVNTEEQEEFLVSVGIPADNIVVDPTVPQCPEQLNDLIEKYTEDDGELTGGLTVCDIAYFGYYPVDCPAATEDIQDPVATPTADSDGLFGLVVNLPPELTSSAFGWVLPKYANNLQLWLQLAYDRVIHGLRGKTCKGKRSPLSGFYPDGRNYSGCGSSGFCVASNNNVGGNNVTSTNTGFPPVQFPIGAFGTNVSYSGCFPVPFLPLCPQFSLCQRFIPAAAAFEVFLPELDCEVKAGKVSIGNSC